MMSPKNIVTIDFETYYSKDYTLRSPKYNTSGYVRDLQFKAHLMGIKINDDPVAWVDGPNIAAVLGTIDWANTALLAHHTAFDGLILSHHYGVVPAYYLDTMSMGRALHSNVIGASLDKLARFYRLGNKLPDVLDKLKGVRDPDPELLRALGMYCAMDTELCYQLYHEMVDKIPQDELDLIDITVRMFCDPVLEIDMPRVERALQKELEHKEFLINNSGVSLATLSSSPKFAKELENCGVEVPKKISPTTKEETFAFSKTDLAFTELLNSPDERVVALVRGRLAAKSTINESRAKRFLDAGEGGNRLPVYLNYYGAHTGRWSAGNKMNMQNLRRGGELRRSILAPKGHVIVVADSAQIEARVTAWLACDDELIELFARGEDVYKKMASVIYNVHIDDVTKEQRFIGKIAILGLGYGMGAAKFQHTLATGSMGPAVRMTIDECQQIVAIYRKARHQITALWRKLDSHLYDLMTHQKEDIIKDVLHIDEGKVYLPNGMFLSYPFMEADYDNLNDRMVNYRYYDYNEGIKKRFGVPLDKSKAHHIYGGLLTKNIVQALARIIVSDQMLEIKRNIVDLHHPGARLAKASGCLVGRIVTMTHDEIVVCCPEEQGEQMLEYMLTVMKKAPKWCANLPLSAEGGWDANYSK